MALLSISEAARAASVARSTIHRAIKEGRISVSTQPNGTKGIDTSELFRVFGEPSSGSSATPRQAQDYASKQLDLLQSQLDAMRQELDAARDREQWFREQLELEQQERRALEQRLLSAPAKRGFWGRWFRRQ